MKKNIFILICSVCFSLSAQNNEKVNKYERIKALKISYLTEKLELTTNEAEKFWPIYNAFEKKHHNIRRQKRELHRKSKEVLSDQAASKAVLSYVKEEEKQFLLMKDLVDALSPVLSSQKILKLLDSEESFRRKLLKQFHKRGR